MCTTPHVGSARTLGTLIAYRLCSMPHRPWEYKLISMRNPLEPDVQQRANSPGKHGWELAAIDAGVWVCKRYHAAEASSPLESIIEETLPVSDVTPSPV